MWLAITSVAGILLFAFLSVTRALSDRDGCGYGRFMMASFVVSLVAVPFANWHCNMNLIVVVLLSGVLIGISNIPSFMAYGMLSPLVVSIVGQLYPVLILIFSFFILGEGMTGKAWLSFIIILGGTTLAAIEKGAGRKNLKGLLLLIAGLMLASLWQPIVKLSGQESLAALDVFIWCRVGVAIGGMLVITLPTPRKRMMSLFSLERGRWHYIMNELTGSGFGILIVWAISIMPKTLNTSMVSVAYLGVTQLAMFVLSLKRKEKGLKLKVIGALISFAGLLYLALNV